MPVRRPRALRMTISPARRLPSTRTEDDHELPDHVRQVQHRRHGDDHQRQRDSEHELLGQHRTRDGAGGDGVAGQPPAPREHRHAGDLADAREEHGVEQEADEERRHDVPVAHRALTGQRVERRLPDDRLARHRGQVERQRDDDPAPDDVGLGEGGEIDAARDHPAMAASALAPRARRSAGERVSSASRRVGERGGSTGTADISYVACRAAAARMCGGHVSGGADSRTSNAGRCRDGRAPGRGALGTPVDGVPALGPRDVSQLGACAGHPRCGKTDRGYH